MKTINWRRIIGLGLSVFALSIGSVGLTGCETGEEVEEELEQEEAPLEEDD
ncbi:hypothetical protein IQ255_26620 [Pleurocapsales cyanobacterium LEGE 10410]|nr:hypothetical protein [Pleurocapsales cyanobacterium LEGE 10410]